MRWNGRKGMACRAETGGAGEGWWAWVDLNYRPRPYQSSAIRFYNNLQDRGDCHTPRKSYKTTQIVGWIVGSNLLERSCNPICEQRKVSLVRRCQCGKIAGGIFDK